MLRRPITALGLALLPLLVACDAKQLYMANQTVIGLNAAVDPEAGTGSLLIGYDRDFVALVPRSVEQRETDAQGKVVLDADGKPRLTGHTDAMSALVCADVRFEKIWLRYYYEAMATGEAAKQFARKLSATNAEAQRSAASMREFFKCFRRAEAGAADGQPPANQGSGQ